jgi:putative endopeptidase
VKKHLPDTSRIRVEKMVDMIVRAFREAVDEAEWMTPEARRTARDKLGRMSASIGYPARWRDYSRLRIAPDDLLGNAQRAFEFDNAYNMRMLRRRTVADRWAMPPQTVNAYYVPARNGIVLPAAVLQPPLFDPEADDAVNYGGIGAIIGHEMSHAFDQRGRRFDAYGQAADWWTARDEQQFQQRARLLVEQFNAYSPLPGRFVNGELTLGENIGDLAGLAVAVRAYRLSLQGKPSPVIDGLSGEQRLFVRWAQIWRSKTRETYLPKTLFLDQHAPPEYRAHGAVVNLDAFHTAFDVQPGDKLYRDPKKRVRIW